LGALSVSDFAERRQGFEGSLIEATFVSAANTYRPAQDLADGALTQHLAAELETAILSLGPENVAAFIFEPIVGAAGGVVPAPDGYAKAVQAVCTRHEVVLIADEVMCGSGRSGTWRTLEQDGAVPDLMTIAKGLAGGYVPLGAVLISPRIAACIHGAHGEYRGGQTFSGHSTACAAGLAVQRIIERDGLLARVRCTGASFQHAIREALSTFEQVGDVRGRGFFIGIELVRDRARKTPFPKERALSAEVGARAFADGLICYPCAGNVDGIDGDTIIIAPPYNATDAELEEIIVLLRGAVAASLARI
jgi:adenosylmethionine-8-amino-7-oxononanoate aminotransferase